MEKADRKRPAADGESSSSSPPPYGSQEYWDERYKRVKMENDGEEPDPFHAWYFNWEELAPLILPLILGEPTESGDKESSELSKGNDAEGVGGDSSEKQDDPNKVAVTTEKNSESGDDSEDEDEESGHDNESDDGSPSRVGLAKDGPIEILEVGCGDVPLGPDIIKSILELEQSESSIVATKILKRVVCIDYSAAVIDAMKAKVKSESTLTASAPLEYECVDARKMPYDNGRFQLILEKGTMDAMLSDTKMGSVNCRAIVSEMSRVLCIGGCIMVISHINAQTENGMDWLNSIVVPGLQQGSGWNKWSVEVHGNEAGETELDDDSAGPGPAVYIMHKGELVEKPEKSDDADLPTVSLRFFAY